MTDDSDCALLRSGHTFPLQRMRCVPQ